MAKLDLTGLMTGLPTDQDLRTQGQARAAQIQGGGLGSNLARGIASRAPQREEMMRQGLGGMFGVDTRTGDQQRKAGMQQALSGLKLDTPEGLMQLAEIHQATGNTDAALKAITAARALEENIKVKILNQKRRESLIEQAGSLSLESTAELLRNNGDMNEAAKQIRKIEESDTLASKGIKGKIAIARQYNAPESIIKDIQKGTYNQTSPDELLKVIRGDKADLKAFLNAEGETVYGRVNEFSAKVYDEETDQWATPSELGYTPAPVVTKQISSADSVVKQLTAGATKSFLEVNKAGQAAKKILQTNAISRDILGEGARTGFGTEWANKTLEIINTTGLLPEKYMDGVAASKALMASRSLAVLDMIPVFGGGQGFTEKDREFLTNIKGADFSLDSKTIARLLDLEERAARQAIELNNNSLDQVMQLAAVSGETPTDLTSVFYITSPAQREVAPVGAGSTMTPETEAYLRAQGLIQ